MKTLLFLVVLVGAVFNSAVADVSNAQKQHDINFLLWKVTENLRDPHHVELSKTFDPEADLSHYDDGGEAVHHLMEEIKHHRVLEQHHWFSLFNTRQREEALMLYDVLMHCTDWETAVANAAYFRTKMNEGEFVYAIYAAVLHHPLAEHVVLPPLYEVTPHMFTNSEVIQEAYHAKMRQRPMKFHSHFTGSKKNPEQRVAYFGEDIGMNTHHVFWHLEFPFWWSDEHGSRLDRKGENFFWIHHQLTCRFDAERISNHLSPVEELQWDHEIAEGFAPHTGYKFGGSFPSRPDHVFFEDVDGVARVRDMLITENRIRDAIAHGYIDKEDGTHIDIMNDHGIDVIGDVIESSMYSPNAQYYGALHNTAHIMLGRLGDPHGKFDMPPGVMEHFETATRDPGFFRLHKYMDNIFRDHKDSLPAYKKEELEVKEFHIDNFAVEGNLETYFEDFQYSLLNAVDDTEDIADVEISTIVPRLNHREFDFVFDVHSDFKHDHLATIRIFAWPHEDNNGVPYSFDDGRWYAIELDKFWYNMHPGDNHIVRHSRDSSVTVEDVPSFRTLMKKTKDALESEHDLDLSHYEAATGLPNRFLIPKGHETGMRFDLVIFISDGTKDSAVENLHEYKEFNHYGAHGVYPDKRPHGYPFDRHVDDERIFEHLPNFKHIHVKVYHDPNYHP